MPRQKRKPGAQPGNSNAVTHGLYRQALSTADQIILDAARALSVSDLEEEIATLRVRIYNLVDIAPDNVELLQLALGRLTKMMIAHYQMNRQQAATFTDELQTLVNDINLTLTRI